MSTAIAIEELPEVLETPTSTPFDKPDPQVWPVQHPPKRRVGSMAVKVVKWASIMGLLALGGLWSRVTPLEVVARFLVAAGAIVVMARSLLAERYAVLAVAGALVLLYNPLAPLFDLSGDWQRAVFVAAAAPLLALLIWRDMRTGSAAFSLLALDSELLKPSHNSRVGRKLT